jgi:hypothetical protein
MLSASQRAAQPNQRSPVTARVTSSVLHCLGFVDDDEDDSGECETAVVIGYEMTMDFKEMLKGRRCETRNRLLAWPGLAWLPCCATLSRSYDNRSLAIIRQSRDKFTTSSHTQTANLSLLKTRVLTRHLTYPPTLITRRCFCAVCLAQDHTHAVCAVRNARAARLRGGG